MEEACYSPAGSIATTSQNGAATATWRLSEGADAWPLASEIRQLLGEDCELDPAFFETSWTSGQPATGQSRGCRQERPATSDVPSGTFAELRGLGGFFFSQAAADSRGGHAHARAAAPSASYTASWLQEPLEAATARATAHAVPTGSGASGEPAKDSPMQCSSRYQRACELLQVRHYSTEAQIKAAYRHMVGQWHPDRLERSGEEVRAIATKQMAAINEAYCFLRRHPPMARC